MARPAPIRLRIIGLHPAGGVVTSVVRRTFHQSHPLTMNLPGYQPSLQALNLSISDLNDALSLSLSGRPFVSSPFLSEYLSSPTVNPSYSFPAATVTANPYVYTFSFSRASLTIAFEAAGSSGQIDALVYCNHCFSGLEALAYFASPISALPLEQAAWQSAIPSLDQNNYPLPMSVDQVKVLTYLGALALQPQSSALLMYLITSIIYAIFSGGDHQLTSLLAKQKNFEDFTSGLEQLSQTHLALLSLIEKEMVEEALARAAASRKRAEKAAEEKLEEQLFEARLEQARILSRRERRRQQQRLDRQRRIDKLWLELKLAEARLMIEIDLGKQPKISIQALDKLVRYLIDLGKSNVIALAA